MAATKVNCPICRRKVRLDDPQMPFCSERCRLADLANWASDKYVISTPTANNEVGDDEIEEEPEGSER